MALDRSALLELLEMMRSADAGQLMHRPLGAMLQKLVDAEATAFIGTGPQPADRGNMRSCRRSCASPLGTQRTWWQRPGADAQRLAPARVWHCSDDARQR